MEPKNRLSALELAFSSYSAPEQKVVMGTDWVLYGTDSEWKNRYPDYLISLFNTSAKHNAIIRGKVDYIVGGGIEVNGELGTMAAAQLQAFIKGNDLNDLLGQVAMDIELFGGCAIEVTYNATNAKIARLSHLTFTKVRLSKDEKTIYYSPDGWKKSKPEDVKSFAAFNASNPVPTSVLYVKTYEPTKSVYPLPSYIGAIPYIELDGEIANFHLNGIKNGFMAGTMISFFNGEPTPDDKRAIEQKVNDKFAGTDNSNKILLTFNDTKDQGPEITSLNGNDLDGRFAVLNSTVQQEIFTGHRIVDPALFGVKSEGLFTTRNQIRDSFELFQNTYIASRQAFIEDVFNGLASVNGLPKAISIKEVEPIALEFSEMTLVGVMTPDEIRAKAGLPVSTNTSEADTTAKDAQAALKGTVGGVTGIITVLQNVQQGIINAQSAVELLIELYGFERSQAESIVLGRTLTPTAPAAMAVELSAEDSDYRLFLQLKACATYINPDQIKGSQHFGHYLSLEDMQAREGELIAYGFNDAAFDMAVLDALRKSPSMGMAEIAATLKTTIEAVQLAVNRNITANYLTLEITDVIGSTQRVARISNAGEQALRLVKPLPASYSIAYRYVLSREMPKNEPDLLPTSRKFCVDMIAETNRGATWTQAAITRLSFGQDSNVWQRRGGFWTRKSGAGTTHYCRHAWERVLISK